MESNLVEQIKNPRKQAPALLVLGSLIWKALAWIQSIDFILSIKEGKLAMMLDFLLGHGWWIIATFGVIWFLVAKDSKGSSSPWSLALSASVIAFLFGVMVTIRATGSVPDIITTWGKYDQGCEVTLATSRLQSFRDRYRIGFICGVEDIRIDKFEDDAVTVSGLFTIAPRTVQIRAPYKPGTKETHIIPGTRVWYEGFIVPKDVSKDKITSLADIGRLGGKIIREGYFDWD